MNLWALSWKSLANRKITSVLTVLSFALGVLLLLGVEKVRTETRQSFISTVSGTDLIIGARSGPVNLLLYSVFRIGNATNNISWQSYQDIASSRSVAWSVPIALGDSHKGFRVLGTTPAYFEHIQYGAKQSLTFAQGVTFDEVFDVVLGADVAKTLGYQLGENIVIAHGAGTVSFVKHDNLPFKVVGILAPTGTPSDRTVFVSLAGIEAIHEGWQSGSPSAKSLKLSHQDFEGKDLQPETITAAFVGLKSRMAAFQLQRAINEYREEALLAIMPALTLQELWQLIGIAEKSLLVVSALVVFSTLLGMMITMLSSLQERRREIAILRAVGARPHHIFFLLTNEALFIAVLGALLGWAALYLSLYGLSSYFVDWFGIHLAISAPNLKEAGIVLVIVFAALIMSLIPGWRAYKNSLFDGLTVRT
ncbi:ABC transporter permease [Litoribrevibacter albus]|uniref:Peptide ABC transporter permease n=1 Tax=Litoribrevibacter albus TaxID=1473156 RepID=A0AA37W8M3_9GAMM|nr:ABC transporter permease [Litoribrevibacter albus]GLQ32638.1 peptide ABC transporter permease [Litoribrevibacter albus]